MTATHLGRLTGTEWAVARRELGEPDCPTSIARGSLEEALHIAVLRIRAYRGEGLADLPARIRALEAAAQKIRSSSDANCRAAVEKRADELRQRRRFWLSGAEGEIHDTSIKQVLKLAAEGLIDRALLVYYMQDRRHVPTAQSAAKEKIGPLDRYIRCLVKALTDRCDLSPVRDNTRRNWINKARLKYKENTSTPNGA